MELSSKYNPQGLESEWYQAWMDNDLFRSRPDEREPYTIVIPPPNVTGVLHMGHMLNNTLQDILIRRARMLGKNACWVPGTDHASIATEAKVVEQLREEGLSKADVGRDGFLERAFAWKEKYGGIILEQLRKLGCSCDWERTKFTMEESLSAAVIHVFNDLYERGYIYRGKRMVNWDPVGRTALSDEEVNHVEQQAQLYYIAYPMADGSGSITIATTRPETLLGDTAVCVNPGDQRYTNMVGKECIVPVVNRKVPIIADDYVDAEFGTGALKVTPAHDINDFEIGQRHKLAVIDVFDEHGRMSEAAGHFIGEDRFVVREKMANQLEAEGQLVKVEEITNKIGLSERTKAPIEPKLSLQWFVNMEQFMADHPEVLQEVLDDEIHIYPEKYKKTYNNWLTNIKDWCISRQLWWGHRIPAWYLPNGDFVIAHDADEALAKARALDPALSASELKQDEDVLDTWFSSWLWPISVFDGFSRDGSEDFDYYYPTSDLVTGPDIIFFWVARMVMAGHAFKGEKPFSRVFFTGIVRDKQRRKMSKSLGNSPDALQLMDTYGTDGVRMGLMLSAAAGNDLLFDEALCEQGRNFCNKLWNSFRLIQGWETSAERDAFYAKNGDMIHDWMEQRIASSIQAVNGHFDEFRISDALMELYKLSRDDFSSWYLEAMKPAYGQPIPRQDLDRIKANYDLILRLLHPYMPFITEHLWQNLEDRQGAFINQSPWPELSLEAEVISPSVFALISEIRAKRNEHNLSPKLKAELGIRTADPARYSKAEDLIIKLAHTGSISFDMEVGMKSLVGTDQVFIQFEGLTQKVDADKIQREIQRLEGFLFGIDKKLGNEKFMANAQAEVIEREQQKRSDTVKKIEALKEQLAQA